jgi:hypothetical protein
MVVYSLHVPYVTLSAPNEPDNGLAGKGAWRSLASVNVVSGLGVNQFALLRSGVHS